MDTWDLWCEDSKHVNDMLDGHQLILFFRKGDDVFGAPEESRLAFAKMKDGKDEDEISPKWKDDASFIALNLIKSMLGDPVENMFSMKDMPNLQIIDRDEAFSKLIDHKKKDKKAKK
jgi:hypothetical protein